LSLRFCCAGWSSSPRAADDPAPGTPTRMLRQPAVSATHIAFAYASNI
jgi:hypothetical protein